jgi:4-aminobutyrate aminotransferase-like enzyme
LKEEAGVFVFEPFIAEGGFKSLDEMTLTETINTLKDCGVIILADETQTFLKSTSVFACSKMGLSGLIDVLVVGKALQSAAVLFRKEFTPPQQTLRGTFAGSTSALAAGCKILDFLTTHEFYGEQKRIAEINSKFVNGLQQIAAKMKTFAPSEIDSCGLLVGFSVSGANAELTMQFVKNLFKAGLLVAVCGPEGNRIRFHLPAIIEDEEIQTALRIIESQLTFFGTNVSK